MDLNEKKRNYSYELVQRRYELVPPDGGWGYLVSVAAIIMFTTALSFLSTFGMLYNEFINETGMSSASVTLVSGINSISGALAAFFTSPLLKIISKRQLGFIAAVIFFLGNFGTVFMTSPLLFFISQGIMQGIGMGIMYNLSCTAMNDYFLEKRVLIMSFVQTATGITAMVAPIFVKWSLEEFGSRGTLLLISGLSLHNFLAVLIMQPVQWHMKKVDVPEKADHKVLIEDKSEFKKLDTPVIKLTDLESNLMKSYTEKAPKITDENGQTSGIRKILESLIDISLCKTFLLSCVLIGPGLCLAADLILMATLPQYLYSMEWSKEKVAMTVSLYGLGDLTARAILTFVSKWVYKLGVQETYIVGIAIAVISRLGILCSSSETTAMVFFTLMGVAHCSVAVLLPVIVSESVLPEKFTSAMGLCLLFTGILGVSLGPAIGAIRDLTNSHSIAFHTLTVVYAIIVVLWSIELFVKKNKERRKIVKMDSKSSQLNKVTE